ncbi:hypothetical protein PROFUN_02130 [Planoprotostelium fungivorum]|uniref:Uncharacterized protein n=1 Tax=Planoprotostelium fungivorum TaxID=1890364 RepID=A0A2P6NZ65_9EUKA|nr:hypothetical protein PROFUN_02130 [Planoprotostelium fungivorum]
MKQQSLTSFFSGRPISKPTSSPKKPDIKSPPKSVVKASPRDVSPPTLSPSTFTKIPTTSSTRHTDPLDDIFGGESIVPSPDEYVNDAAVEEVPLSEEAPIENVSPAVDHSVPTTPTTPKKKIMTFSKRRPFVDQEAAVASMNTSVEFVSEVEDVKWSDRLCTPSPKKKAKTQSQPPNTPRMEQSFLDFGQKNFGAPTVCATCSMRYQAGVEDDEELHKTFHRRFLDSSSDIIEFNGWKDEEIIRNFEDGSRLIRINTTDAKMQSAKMKQLDQVVTRQVGGPIDCDGHPQQLYLYVSSNKKIIGCVCARVISEARRKTQDGHGKAEPAEVCVTRVWVQKSKRRQKIATQMMDAMKSTIIYGKNVEKDRIAYLQTTQEGDAFAQNHNRHEPHTIPPALINHDLLLDISENTPSSYDSSRDQDSAEIINRHLPSGLTSPLALFHFEIKRHANVSTATPTTPSNGSDHKVAQALLLEDDHRLSSLIERRE